jgi:hypothetical protein
MLSSGLKKTSRANEESNIFGINGVQAREINDNLTLIGGYRLCECRNQSWPGVEIETPLSSDDDTVGFREQLCGEDPLTAGLRINCNALLLVLAHRRTSIRYCTLWVRYRGPEQRSKLWLNRWWKN